MDHQAVAGGSPETCSSGLWFAIAKVHRSNDTFTVIRVDTVPLPLASSFESSGFIEQALQLQMSVLGAIYSWHSIGPMCFLNPRWDPT